MLVDLQCPMESVSLLITLALASVKGLLISFNITMTQVQGVWWIMSAWPILGQ
jgi:hypothetical protein